ncbi:MAG TPA: aminopeptidase [Ktedonobacterales bacterium]|nr:aminopeptidase [Ktedonobacterales bacterium]
MADTRLAKLAHLLVTYSLRLQPGDLLQINTTPLAAPLVREVYREALLAGAHPYTRISLPETQELLLKYGSDAQIGYAPRTTQQEIEDINALLTIWAEVNTRHLSGVDPAKMALLQQGQRAWRRTYFERSASGDLRWCGTQFPTEAAAQDAEMSLLDYEDFVYGAGKLDAADPVAEWQAVHTQQQRIADLLGTKREIRLVAPGTDLTYATDGRRWLNADGTANFPDGEVFTSPVETKTRGHISFTYPAVYGGYEVEGVRLAFEEGHVVEASAEKGEELLRTQLDLDEGARRLGEAAFGLNYDIQRFSRNTLFDEKIGGTIHLALGQSFPEVGGQNASAVHWDMVCDMRAGEVFADGELIYKDGRFIV